MIDDPRKVFIYRLPGDFLYSIFLSSGNTIKSIVTIQAVPPMTLETGSAINTPSDPKWKAPGRRIGADSTTKLELAEIRPTEDNVCYTFFQMAGDLRVYGDAVKLITDNDGKAIGLVSAILPNVKAAPADEWSITEQEAEAGRWPL